MTGIALLMISLLSPAQELDSLKAIMGVEGSQNNENTNTSPVQVYDEGDQVRVNMGDKEMLKVVDQGDSTTVTVGKNQVIEVYDHPDSTRIRVGNREISIVENNNKSDIHIGRVHDRDHQKWSHFKGHWAGFGWGINNFMDADFTLSREGDAAFMDLNTSRSWNINLNFAQFSMGFGSSYIGAVTGLGLEFNNYFFDNSNSIDEVNDMVVSRPLDPSNLAKSKLTTSFLKIPVLIEAQFPNTSRDRRVHISAGLVGGLKLGSHAKVVYKNDDGKDKSKDKDDFNINPFRYGLAARLGYGCIDMYAEYYITPMFVADKGPELHPFNIGLALNF
jgi:hypothetical protein